MNQDRMTIEELLELKPSMENPIELVCDNGDYQNDLFKIKVVCVHKDRLCVINNNDMLTTIHGVNLSGYPSFKQPKKRNLEVFYEVFHGSSLSLKSENDNFIIGNNDGSVTVSKTRYNYPLIPNGLKLIYDHDNKKLLAYNEELLK